MSVHAVEDRPRIGRPPNRFRRKPRHRHDYKRVGYGGAGWSVFRCACGATEIDA